jgi:hypothetical protein
MKRSMRIPFVAVSAACMLLSCSPMKIADGGNSSGTGNGAMVRAASDRIIGVTMHLAEVRLYSQDWKPFVHSGSYSDSSVADSSGAFTFTGIPRGYYNLTIFSADQKSAGIFQNIPCQPAVSWADTIDTLKAPGILHGYATIKTDTLALSYVYVKGTPFFAMTNTRGEFSINAFPQSHYTVQLYGLYIRTGNGALQAITSVSSISSLAPSAIIDSVTVTIFPDSVVQLTR